MAVLWVSLCLVSALLLLAVAGLYDRVLNLERGLVRARGGSAVGLPYGARLENAALAHDFTGFIVLSDSDADPFAHWFAARRAAERWGYDTVVLIADTQGGADWARILTDEGADVRVAAADLLATVKPDEVPVTLFCQDGRIIDSARGATTPRAVEQHFTLAAAPSLIGEGS